MEPGQPLTRSHHPPSPMSTPPPDTGPSPGDGGHPGSPSSAGAAREGPPDGAEPALDRALALVRFLRAHCPWDAKQTARSLVPYLLEECHETVDAIHAGDADALEGELGDLLLNVAFQIVVGEEEERFTAESITARLEEKMARRHPHLYGLGEAESWEVLKAREREEERDPGEERGVLADLASGLDPLTKAHRIQDRVSGVGFDWSDYRGGWRKVEEELHEVREAIERELEGASSGGVPEEPHASSGTGRGLGGEAGHGVTPDAVEEELGDLLFAVVNLVRLAGRHPTTALERANRKFRRRFEAVEALARERGVAVEEAGLEALDELWDEVKRSDTDAP